MEDDTKYDDDLPRWSENSSTASNPDTSDEGQIPKTLFSQQQYYVQTHITLLSKISLVIRRSGAKLRHELADAALSVRYNHYDALRKHLRWVMFMTTLDHREKPSSSVDTLLASWAAFENSPLSAVQVRLIEAVVIRRNRFEFAKSPWRGTEVDIETSSTERAGKRKSEHGQVLVSKLAKTSMTPHSRENIHVRPGQDPRPKASRKTWSTAESAIFSLTATAVGSDVLQFSGHLMDTDLASFTTQVTDTQITLQDEYPSKPIDDSRGNNFQCQFCRQVLPKETIDTNTKWR